MAPPRPFHATVIDYAVAVLQQGRADTVWDFKYDTVHGLVWDWKGEPEAYETEYPFVSTLGIGDRDAPSDYSFAMRNATVSDPARAFVARIAFADVWAEFVREAGNRGIDAAEAAWHSTRSDSAVALWRDAALMPALERAIIAYETGMAYEQLRQ